MCEPEIKFNKGVSWFDIHFERLQLTNFMEETMGRNGISGL